MSPNDIKVHLVQEDPEGHVENINNICDSSLHFSDKYKAERIRADAGIAIERFGYFLSELYIKDASFCPLQGSKVMYISRTNKYFIRSMY